MTDVIVRIYAKNTGVQHDLILGASLLDYDWNVLYDMVWAVYHNAPAGMPEPTWMQTGVTGTFAPGTYRIIAKAWETYDLTGATLKFEGEGWSFYSGGFLYGELDTRDTTFDIVAGQVSAEITDLQLTI